MRFGIAIVATVLSAPALAQEPQAFCKHINPSGSVDLSILDSLPRECRGGDIVAMDASALWISRVCDFNKQIVIAGRTALCTLVPYKREVRISQ